MWTVEYCSTGEGVLSDVMAAEFEVVGSGFSGIGVC